MMSLCQNRVGGFGPTSPFSSPIPTPCFVDTIIIPLPVWIYLALIPVTVYLSRRHSSLNPSTSHLRHGHRRSKLRTAVSVLYYALVVANILMVTLEIVRLALIHQSPTLLPFQYVALLIGGGLHYANGVNSAIRSRYWRAANVVLWTGLMAVSITKTVGLLNDMDRDGEKREGREKGTKYPLDDQVIDVAVMAGVYAVIAGLEVALGLWKKSETFGEERGSMEEGIIGNPMAQRTWAK